METMKFVALEKAKACADCLADMAWSACDGLISVLSFGPGPVPCWSRKTCKRCADACRGIIDDFKEFCDYAGSK